MSPSPVRDTEKSKSKPRPRPKIKPKPTEVSDEEPEVESNVKGKGTSNVNSAMSDDDDDDVALVPMGSRLSRGKSKAAQEDVDMGSDDQAGPTSEVGLGVAQQGPFESDSDEEEDGQVLKGSGAITHGADSNTQDDSDDEEEDVQVLNQSVATAHNTDSNAQDTSDDEDELALKPSNRTEQGETYEEENAFRADDYEVEGDIFEDEHNGGEDEMSEDEQSEGEESDNEDLQFDEEAFDDPGTAGRKSQKYHDKIAYCAHQFVLAMDTIAEESGVSRYQCLRDSGFLPVMKKLCKALNAHNSYMRLQKVLKWPLGGEDPIGAGFLTFLRLSAH